MKPLTAAARAKPGIELKRVGDRNYEVTLAHQHLGYVRLSVRGEWVGTARGTAVGTFATRAEAALAVARAAVTRASTRA